MSWPSEQHALVHGDQAGYVLTQWTTCLGTWRPGRLCPGPVNNMPWYMETRQVMSWPSEQHALVHGNQAGYVLAQWTTCLGTWKPGRLCPGPVNNMPWYMETRQVMSWPSEHHALVHGDQAGYVLTQWTTCLGLIPLRPWWPYVLFLFTCLCITDTLLKGVDQVWLRFGMIYLICIPLPGPVYILCGSSIH